LEKISSFDVHVHACQDVVDSLRGINKKILKASLELVKISGSDVTVGVILATVRSFEIQVNAEVNQERTLYIK
jgi:hypothetical protein